MSPNSIRIPLRFVMTFGLCAGIMLSGCHSDRVSVNSKDPRTPQFEYRLDELALLQMAADDIQSLEQKKDYGRIYDEYGSADFQKSVSRRLFLIMSNCVENDLGSLMEFDSTNQGFRREYLPHSKKPLDTITRRAERTQEVINEQMVFLSDGLNFKLNSIYWIARDKNFLECIANSPTVEASSAPQPELIPGAPGTTQTTTQTPEGTPTQEGQPPAGTSPTDQTGQTGTGTATGQPATTSQPAGAAGTGATPAAPTVQELKPGELKKEAPAVKPAGAGAVVDTRPAPPPKPEKPAETKPDATAPGTSTTKPVPGEDD